MTKKALSCLLALTLMLTLAPLTAFAAETPSDFGLSTAWTIGGSETFSNIFDINNNYNWVYLANNNTIYGIGNSYHEGTHELATNAKKIFCVEYDYMVYLDMDNTLYVSDYTESKTVMTSVIDAKVGYNNDFGSNYSCLLALCYDGSVYAYNVGKATNMYSKGEFAGPWLLANDGARLATMSTGSPVTGVMPIYINNDGHIFSTIKDKFNDKYVKAAIEQEWKITAIRDNLDFDKRASGNSAIWRKTVLLAYNDEKHTWCIIDYLDTVDGSVEEPNLVLGSDFSAFNEHSIADDSVNMIVNDFVKWRHFVIRFSSGTYGSIKELSGELTVDDTLYFGGTKVAENVKCYNSFYSQLWFLTKNGDFFMSKLNANSDFELTQTNINFAYLWNMGAIYFVANDGRLTDSKGNVIATNVKLIDKIYDTVATSAPILTHSAQQTTPPSGDQTANPASSKVLVNGIEIAFDAYFINNNNYFKLRDIAYILSGTAKQFEIGYDRAANAISLTSGQPYTVVGGEMEGKGGGAKTPAPTDSKILLNGAAVSLTAYNIEGNNYFKLRDIGAEFDFSVDWDGANNAIVIDTSKGYMAE